MNIKLTDKGKQNIRQVFSLAEFPEHFFMDMFDKQWDLKSEDPNWEGHVYGGPIASRSLIILGPEDYVVIRK